MRFQALEDISEDDDRVLAWYGVHDGDEIHVEEVDPEERLKAAEQLRQEQREALAIRAAQQLVEGDRLKASAANAFM